MNTKERILQVALGLFARRGYTAVSVRDICREVAIKESSIYYYFNNKQAIIDELFARFEARAEALMRRFESALAESDMRVDDDGFGSVCGVFFEEYLLDDFCLKMLQLLQIERSGSPAAQRLYDLWMFERPLAFQTKVFELYVKAGTFRGDGERLALEFYAPIYLFAQRWLLGGEENREAFRADAYAHVGRFFAEIGGR